MEVLHIDFKNPSKIAINDYYKEFNNCFREITRNVDLLGLTQTQSNTVYNSMTKLIRANSKLANNFCGSDSVFINKAENYICDEIKKHSSIFRRKKLCEESTSYVKAEEKAIGLQWKSQCKVQSNSVCHTIDQNKFSFVSIISTLTSLLSDPYNFELFMEKKHKCTPGIYERFCCGEIHSKSQFFKENPNAIQLLLSIDEFEPCSPVKTKCGVYKITAIYMQILNFPSEYLSRLENIYLVALCCSRDLKQENTSLDNLLEIIVSEVKSLEQSGIVLPNGIVFKGTLAGFTFDNLGMKYQFYDFLFKNFY